MKLAGDTLKLSTGVKYLKFENIVNTYYSRIIIDSEYIYSGYKESFQIIPYTIDRPLPWSELKAEANLHSLRPTLFQQQPLPSPFQHSHLLDCNLIEFDEPVPLR